MALFPFNEDEKQRYFSMAGFISGVLLMIYSSEFFVLGVIVFFVSLLYFLDAQ